MQMFIPVTKVDEQKREVYGIATAEIKDKSGETMDYVTSKPLFEKWSADIEKASGGKSKGNVRLMHQPINAGKLTDLVFNDSSRQIECCAKVTDDKIWNDVLEGVLTGFSIGGAYENTWMDTAGQRRYTAKPSEISLVDNPCLGDATFAVIKMDGSIEQKSFKEVKKLDLDNKIAEDFKKAFASKDLVKAFAYEEITNRLQGALNAQIKTPYNMGYFWIKATYADSVIICGNIDGDGDEDLYRVAYTMDDDGVIKLGTIQEVKMEFIPAIDEDDIGIMVGLPVEKSDINKIAEREDVSEAEESRAKEKYGDVTYADEKNSKYPIDTEAHVRAAASYFGMPKNRSKYSAEDQKKIDAKIASAKKKFGIGEDITKSNADGDEGRDIMEVKDKKDDVEKMTKDPDPTLRKDPDPDPDPGKLSDTAHKASSKAFSSGKADDHLEAADAHHKAALAHDGQEEKDHHIATAGVHAGAAHSQFAKSAKAIKNVADELSKLANVDLAKAGATHSKDTLAKLSSIHHTIGNEMGAACKCGKCSKMYAPALDPNAPQGSVDVKLDTDENMVQKDPGETLMKEPGMEKDDEVELDPNKLKSELDVEDLSETKEQLKTKPDAPAAIGKFENSDELQKLAKGIEDLQKAFTSVKSENEVLTKKVTELENQPIPGGPVLNSVALEKMLGGHAMQKGEGVDGSQLEKAYSLLMDNATQEQKQQLSVMKAQDSIKLSLANPVSPFHR